MPDLQVSIRTRLIAAGTPAEGRVYWVERPQGSKLPAITLQVISDARPQHLKGNDGARATRVQCDCWAGKYGEALALARAAIAALQPPANVDGKRFANAQVAGQRDLGEGVGGGAFSDGPFVHRQSVDFIIWHVGD